MVRTIIQLTEERAAELRKRAKAQGVSIAELVRQGVDRLLATTSPNDDIRKKALSVIGCISDPKNPDLAMSHDKYL